MSDSQLTKEAQIFEPLVVAAADRSSDCVNRFHKNFACYCCVETIWYSNDNLMFVVWDLEDLEGIGLPHCDSNQVVFCLKSYLPVLWIAANPQAYAELEAPSGESLQRVDVEKNLSLSDVFALVMGADKFVESSWERSPDDPRMRARMTDMIYKVARQNHQRFADHYLNVPLSFSSKLSINVVERFRHPFTGGLRPKKKKTAGQQRAELLPVNVIRVLHETYCHVKEGFDPLISFKKRLAEQFAILKKRAEEFNASIELAE